MNKISLRVRLGCFSNQSFIVILIIIICANKISISSSYPHPQNEEEEDPEPKLCNVGVLANNAHQNNVIGGIQQHAISLETVPLNKEQTGGGTGANVATVGHGHGHGGGHRNNHHHGHGSAQSSTSSQTAVANSISSTNVGGHHGGHGQGQHNTIGGHHGGHSGGHGHGDHMTGSHAGHGNNAAIGSGAPDDGEDNEPGDLETVALSEALKTTGIEGARVKRRNGNGPNGRAGKTIDLFNILNFGNQFQRQLNPQPRARYSHRKSCSGQWLWHEGHWGHGIWHPGQWLWHQDHCHQSRYHYQYHGIDIDRKSQSQKTNKKKEEVPKKKGRKKFTGGYHRRGHFG